MNYNDILVFLDGGESNSSRVETAIAFAKAHDAHVVGVAYNIDVPRHIATLIPGFSTEKQREASRIIAENLANDFLKAANESGVSASTTIMKCRESSAPAKLAAYARNFDISIMRQVGENSDQSNFERAVSEEVLFSSGRPVLYIPYIGAQTPKPQKALIAWDGSRAATRAIHDALPLLDKVGSVVILTVDSDPSTAARKVKRAGAMVDHLNRYGISAEVKFASSEQSDVATTVLNSLVDTGSDILVMGGYGSSKLREYILGGVTKTIFKNMTTPVCMSN
jgi:nucleotide-binding universal stress UspA family protein